MLGSQCFISLELLSASLCLPAQITQNWTKESAPPVCEGSCLTLAGNIRTRGLVTGHSGPHGAWPSQPGMSRTTPSLARVPRCPSSDAQLDTGALPSCQGTFPGFPAAREPGGVSPRAWGRRTSPTYVVILRGVARGGPKEVLGELVLREPVDLAAVGATCASPSPHPQVLTWGGKNSGFSWGRCSKEGGGVLGNTLMSISDGQMESTLSPSQAPLSPRKGGLGPAPSVSYVWSRHVATSSSKRTWKFRHLAALPRIYKSGAPVFWPSSG